MSSAVATGATIAVEPRYFRRPWWQSIVAASPASDPRAVNARPDVWRFTVLGAQLAAILTGFIVLRVEEPLFVGMLGIVAASFAVHYWLPFALKEHFLIGASLVAAFLLLGPVNAALLVFVGLLLYAIVASGLRYPVRVALVVAVGGLLAVGRVIGLANFGVPDAFWAVAGSIFMFRLMIYLYDLRHATGKPSLKDFLSYFFLIPNYYFVLFPVIDFQSMRKSYYQRDIHHVAQVGVSWIFRGLVQLLVYRLVVQYKQVWAPETITSLPDLVRTMVLIYMLYLRVSGTFHIIIGVMHLFGYNLPETHRRYLLASSLTDFWRRINIYWKDFMVKLVYFPLYFRLRKSGEVRAQVLATSGVFVATWFLHAYQYFWLSGSLLFSETDIAFWGILGGVVVVNVLVEARQRRTKRSKSPLIRVQQGLQIALTFVFITTLWSLWNTPTVTEWFDILTWWQFS